MTRPHFPRSRIRFIANETSDDEPQGARPLYVDALDNVPLALYKYFPAFEPDKIVIFYHDAGLYQCPQYHEMALVLSQKYNMGVYLAELRGHGFSGGRIDRLSSGEALLDDIEQIVRWVACRHMKARLYLGAHSQSCALISYYGVMRHPAPLSGFVMIAPYLGPFSLTNLLQLRRGTIKPPLNHTRFGVWLLHYLSSGAWWRYQTVWQFDPSPLVGSRDPKRVSRYNSEVARFMNVLSPREQFSRLGAPFFALLPSRDERCDLERLRHELEVARQRVLASSVQQAADGDFIGLLQLAPAFISKQTTLQAAMA